jgi:hypothetical protein
MFKVATKGKIVELLAIVRLESKNGEAKLGKNIGMKCDKARKNIRFGAQWKGPNIMSEIIY